MGGDRRGGVQVLEGGGGCFLGHCIRACEGWQEEVGARGGGHSMRGGGWGGRKVFYKCSKQRAPVERRPGRKPSDSKLPYLGTKPNMIQLLHDQLPPALRCCCVKSIDLTVRSFVAEFIRYAIHAYNVSLGSSTLLALGLELIVHSLLVAYYQC